MPLLNAKYPKLTNKNTNDVYTIKLFDNIVCEKMKPQKMYNINTINGSLIIFDEFNPICFFL